MKSKLNKTASFVERVMTGAAALLITLATAGTGHATSDATTPTQEPSHTIEREGLKVTFDVQPTLAMRAGERKLMEGDLALMRFKITDAQTGEPVKGLNPGAWMDLSGGEAQKKNELLTCKERIALYLGGATGMRPLLDMNSYFILALNEDATISVIDPAMLVAGVPDNFYTQVVLPRPGADWAKTADEKRLYVSMPQADAVAVIDTTQFKLAGQIKTGSNPVRVAMQPGGRYLWVGNNGKGRQPGGVSIIDLTTQQEVKRLDTGAGHHEITFAGEGRIALVTNRSSGTVTIIDAEKQIKLRDLPIGQVPISTGYSALSQSLYVADGESGEVKVIDGDGKAIIASVSLAPGLGPMRFTPDGRWGFVLNPTADSVYVIDASTNSLAHTLPIAGKPFSISLSRGFAYVRVLESSKVSMIDLSELGGSEPPPVNSFETGTVAPERARTLSIADGVVASPVEAGVVIVNPADSHLYFYMEGMNFPRGSFRSYAHRPQAVQIVDRALIEEEPGTYQSEVKIPMPGKYDVAFILDAPRVIHCFSMDAEVNPVLAEQRGKYKVRYLVEEHSVKAGGPVAVRFNLLAPGTGEPIEGLSDVMVRSFLAPNRFRTDVPAKEVEPGVYEAQVNVPKTGAYYVYVAAPSRELKFADLPFLTLVGVDPSRMPNPPALKSSQ